MAYPHYSRAPIVEAIIDIRIEPVGPESLPLVADLASSLSSEFPNQTAIQFGEFSLAIQPSLDGANAPAVKTTQQRIGTRLARSDNSRILQLRTNGLTYSHLPPYSEWERFRTEAVEYWGRFASVIQPKAITRVAIRYINRIDLPGPKVEPEDYFALYPQIPNEIPQDIVGLFLQLRMPQEDLDGMAIVNLALADPAKPDMISVVLDFDLFCEERLTSVDQAWAKIDQLRERENRLFNACITERTKELIK